MLYEIILNDYKDLEQISRIFNRLNIVYKDKLEMEIQNHVGLPVSSSITVQVYKPLTNMKITLNQSDMYSNVFTKIIDHMYKSSTQSMVYHLIKLLLILFVFIFIS